tara:strand:+ start:1431 stop:1616 length:186 start_codon:yes stop_codon:yes gene_type:complete
MHLAHNEKTRAPVEVHMARPLKYVFWDLLAIEAAAKADAARAKAQSDQTRRDSDRNRRGRK